MSVTHLKLDKFVAGNEKRVFQTDIHLYDSLSGTSLPKQVYHDTEDKIADKQNHTIFYGKYSTLLKANNLDTNDTYYNKLLNFNEVKAEYVSEKKITNIKPFLNSNRYYTNLFEKYTYSTDQIIKYFNAVLDQPIDITGTDNVAYFLSPLDNKQNVEIIQHENLHDLIDYSISADFKPNYSDMYKMLLNKTVTYPEQNAIPVYDLNFTHLETVTFQSLSGLDAWLSKYMFNKLYYKDTLAKDYITCNIDGPSSITYNSINLPKLLNVLSQPDIAVYYSDNMKRELFKQLIDNIEETSFNCYLSVLGNITKLVNKTSTILLSSTVLSSSFNIQNKEIYDNLQKQPNESLYTYSIPHNSLYVMETVNPVLLPANNESRPSAYLNFVNLKNMQTPLSDYEIALPTGALSGVDTVYNESMLTLFDNDKTMSLEFNETSNYDVISNSRTYNRIPTRNSISAILDVSKEYDNAIAENEATSAEYIYYDKNRLETKIKNYLTPFTERHIVNNKSYEIGQLYGIRSYLHTGILDNENNIWLSYKYITSYSNELLNSYTTYYTLPFNEYELNRQNNMQQDYLGTLYQGINNCRCTKEANSQCPYIRNGTNLKEEFGCSASLLSACNGYCTFPYNNKYLIIDSNGSTLPQGHYWNYDLYINDNSDANGNFTCFNKKNSEWFYFPCGDKAVSTELYTETDLNISDDIEIYFSNMEFAEFSEFMENHGSFYKSIFRGFGGANTTVKYDEYLLRNNKDVTTQITYKDQAIGNCFDSIENYANNFIQNTRDTTLKTLFNRQFKFFLNENYLAELDNFSTELVAVFKSTLKSILESPKNITKYGNLCNISFKRLKENTGFITEVPYLNNEYYYDLYHNNLYEFLQDLYLTDTIQLKDLPNIKIIDKTLLLYNNFIIAPDCPFNGPHKIEKNTKLSGLAIIKNTNGSYTMQENTTTILPGWNCYIRVVNWWSDRIKCTGKLSLKLVFNSNYTLETYGKYTKVLQTLNNYDQIEKIDGFFKASQTDYKKSNIYSIKVTNSGFNPENNISLDDFYEYILLKNYVYLPVEYRDFYEFLSIDKLIVLEDKNFKKVNYNESIVSRYSDTILYKLYEANQSSSTLKTVPDIPVFYENDLEHELLTIDKYKNSIMFSYINGQGGIYQLKTDYVKSVINAKEQLKEIFENAITSSVKKYMPVHTDLWKIIYSGK